MLPAEWHPQTWGEDALSHADREMMLLSLSLIGRKIVSQSRMNSNLALVLLPFGVALPDSELCPHTTGIVNIGREKSASFVDSASRIEANSKQRPIVIARESDLK